MRRTDEIPRMARRHQHASRASVLSPEQVQGVREVISGELTSAQVMRRALLGQATSESRRWPSMAVLR
jgi:hypothetical protein